MTTPEAMKLSPRELEVAFCITTGMTNKEIGQLLDVGIESVKEYVSRLLRKLSVRNRAEIAVWAVRNGLGPTNQSIGDTYDEAEAVSNNGRQQSAREGVDSAA